VPPYEKLSDPTQAGDSATILEIRGDGHQTVFPGSVHPTGEAICWDAEGEPAPVLGDQLAIQARALAAACILAAHWPKGTRQDAAMALAGGFLRAGWPDARVRTFIEAVCQGADDEETPQRLEAEAYTAKRVASGLPATGWPPLIDLIGKPVVDRVIDWLGLERNRIEVRMLDAEAPHFTDLGNARRLVRLYGGKLRYCGPWAKWLAWDGRRWAVDASGAVERMAKETIAEMYREAATLPDDQRKALAAWALKSESEGRLNAMIALAASEPGIPVLPDDLDADPWLRNVTNGTIDLRSGMLAEHDSSRLTTKLAPVDYDLEAGCGLWLAFLNRVMGGRADLVRFQQRKLGYALTGDTSERCIFIEYGSGRNGKTVCAETVAAVMGDYARRAPIELLLAKRQEGGIPNDLAALKGARFVQCAESEEGRRLAEATVKALTGGDTITARFMRGEWFEFPATFKLTLATNHKPVIRGTDPAIWDRIRLTPWTVRIPEEEQDKHLTERLREEYPGILAWLVQGCLDWQWDGGLGVPTEVKTATADYQREMDLVGDFLEERCTAEPARSVSRAQLYQTYSAWCEAAGERPVGTRGFAERLRERGFQEGRSKAEGRLWSGLGLNVGDR
jgi:putative DNA primase/helicase